MKINQWKPTPEQKSQIHDYCQKWLSVFSTPIEPKIAAATVCTLYQKAGYAPPKVVFVDSPWAAAIASCPIDYLFPNSLTSVGKDLFDLTEQLDNQLFEQLLSQFEDEYDVIDFIEHFSNQRANSLLFEFCQTYSDPYYSRPSTELDHLAVLLADHLRNTQPYQWLWGGKNPSLKQRSEPFAQQLDRLNEQLFQQLGISLDKWLLAEHSQYRLGTPRWLLGRIADAAAYDFAVSIGIEFEPDSLELFLNCALHLGSIAMFKEVCFVSDRPQFKRDAQGNYHAVGEPAIVFPDKFGFGCFYHGVELPDYCARVHPSQWQPKWVLEAENAEVRRVLIQEIGYARICQHLQAEVLDSWREYTLLKLPIYDDHRRSAQWRQPRAFVDGVEATYLLKMTCPSTGSIYALRVPPNLKSAREAAAWINWGSDPEWFTVET